MNNAFRFSEVLLHSSFILAVSLPAGWDRVLSPWCSEEETARATLFVRGEPAFTLASPKALFPGSLHLGSIPAPSLCQACMVSRSIGLLQALHPSGVKWVHGSGWFLRPCVPLFLLFSCRILSNSLRPCGLQHARLPCPLLSQGACSNSSPLSWWCHPVISSSVAPLSSCPQSFPASGSFPMRVFCTPNCLRFQEWLLL